MSDAAAKRRIGDILLAHGFVSEEALAEAVAEQERTAQPLGQILVQRGAITRLELASALAEQWSDPRISISLPPLAAPRPREEPEYAARLQDAVADLARRVQSGQPLEATDGRLTDLAQRIEATLARTEHTEVAVATLAASLEGVSGRVEKAFVELQAASASLAVDLARIDAAVAALASDPHSLPPPDPVLSADIAALGTVVEALAERPVADEMARVRVDALSVWVEAADELQEGLVTSIAALGARIDEIAEHDARDTAVASRLDGLEARVEAEAAAVAELREDVSARVEPAFEGRLEGLTDALAAIQSDVSARANLAPSDPALADRVERLAERVQQLAAATAEPDSVAARLEAVEARVASDLVTTETLGQALAQAHDEIAGASRPPEGGTEALEQAVDFLRAEVAGLVVPATPDLELARKIERLAAQVEQLTVGRADHDSLVATLEAIETRRLSDLDTIDVLARALDRIRHDLTSIPVGPPSDTSAIEEAVARVDGRLRALDGIEARVDELVETMEAAIPAGSVQVPTESHHELGRRIDRLSSRLDEGLAAIGAPGSPATGQPAESAEAVERIRMAVERLGLHLGEHDRALAELVRSRDVTNRLDELSSRLDQVAAAGPGGRAGPGFGSPADVSGDVRALTRRVEEAETSSQDDRDRLMSRLERMASSIDWRLQRLEIDETE